MPTLLFLLLSATPILAWEDITTYRVLPANVDRLFIQEHGEYLCFSRDPQGRLSRCQLWLILHRVSETHVAALPAKRFDPATIGLLHALGSFPQAGFQDQPVLLNLLQFSHLQLLRQHSPSRPSSRSSWHTLPGSSAQRVRSEGGEPKSPIQNQKSKIKKSPPLSGQRV